MFKFANTAEKVKFGVKSICDGHHNVLYRGVKAIRSPFDYVIYQMIVAELQPDLASRAGTRVRRTTAADL